MPNFAKTLLTWFDTHGRHDLPWQKNKTAYRVWVSEIMLQQTQVTTVIPYYERFMQRFPTLADLAQAPIDDVLAHWSGLGYYARARNLHATAVMVQKEFAGQFPEDIETVCSLPGIGRSTAAAILSIVHNQKLAILDGNVKRVLTRYFAISGWPGNKKIEAELWQRAESLLPDNRMADYTQAIMDLGATLCTRSKPNCLLCPLQESCQARLHHQPENFPEKKPSTKKPEKSCAFLVLLFEEQILLEQRPAKGIWGGLWCLPQFDSLEQAAEQSAELSDGPLEAHPSARHTFSHYHLDYTPCSLELDQPICWRANQAWHSLDDLATLGLPAPIKKWLYEYRRLRFAETKA